MARFTDASPISSSSSAKTFFSSLSLISLDSKKSSRAKVGQGGPRWRKVRRKCNSGKGRALTLKGSSRSDVASLTILEWVQDPSDSVTSCFLMYLKWRCKSARLMPLLRSSCFFPLLGVTRCLSQQRVLARMSTPAGKHA